MARVGYARATTRAAEAAGIAEGTIYRHFPDKQHLFRAAVMERNRPILDRMSALPARAGRATVEATLAETFRHLGRLRRYLLPLELAAFSDPPLRDVIAAATVPPTGAPLVGPPQLLADYLSAEQRGAAFLIHLLANCVNASYIDAAKGPGILGVVPDDALPTRPPFALHEHRRPRHHYDLRLAEDGVLRSWAVPRGLPPDSRTDRLAVAVPDHDLDHLTYEDEDKATADTGWWEEHDRDERRLVFTLHGRAGSVRYARHPDVPGLAAPPHP